MKHAIYLALLLAIAAPHGASAIQVAGEPATAATSRSASSERVGYIGEIDMRRQTISIGGKSYTFSPSTLAVTGARLTSLGKGDRIRFEVVEESGRERISKIWLVAPAQH